MWRIADDVSESLTSILNIINTYERLQDTIAPLAGPGSWNDADQLLIGNDGLNEEECRIQMAMWAILASPLFMSVDLDEIEPWAKDLLTNERVIAINQDPLGRQGVKLTASPPGLGIWVKELSGSRLAIAFLRVQRKNQPEESIIDAPIPLSSLKPFFADEAWTRKFRFDDVFDGELVGMYSFRDHFVIERSNEAAASVMLLLLSLVEEGEFRDHDRAHGEEWKERMESDEMVLRVWRKAQQSKARRFTAYWWWWAATGIVVAILFLLGFKLRSFVYRQLVRRKFIS